MYGNATPFDQVDPVKGAILLRGDAELMPDAQRLFRDLKEVRGVRPVQQAGWLECV
jgi:hypothetical protein